MPLLSNNTQRPKAGRTSGSPARRSAFTGDMIVSLSTGSIGGGFRGTGVGIKILEVGEGQETADEKVAWISSTRQYALGAQAHENTGGTHMSA